MISMNIGGFTKILSIILFDFAIKNNIFYYKNVRDVLIFKTSILLKKRGCYEKFYCKKISEHKR